MKEYKDRLGGAGTLCRYASGRNLHNGGKAVARQTARVQVQRISDDLFARPHCEHPCQSVARAEAANTVPGDVIRGARYRRIENKEEWGKYNAILVWSRQIDHRLDLVASKDL
jgi:hypothetical protein